MYLSCSAHIELQCCLITVHTHTNTHTHAHVHAKHIMSLYMMNVFCQMLYQSVQFSFMKGLILFCL
jgi:hypothetical protein